MQAMKLSGSSSPWIVTGVIITGILCLGWAQLGSMSIINPGLLPVVFALHLITLSVTSYRWQVLLRRLGADLPFGRTMHIHLASRFAAVMTPSLAADAASVGLFRRFTELSYGQLTGSILLQKFTSLLALVAVCMICLVFPGDTGISVAPYAAVLTACLLLAALVRAAPAGGTGSSGDPVRIKGGSGILSRIRQWMGAGRELGAEAVRTSRQLLESREAPRLLAASAVVWALYPLKVYVVTLSLGLEVNYALLAVSAYLACITGMIPVLPGGLGSFEAGMAFMLTRGGLTAGEGLMVALLLRVGTFWLPMLVSGVAAAYIGASLWRADDQRAAVLDAGD